MASTEAGVVQFPVHPYAEDAERIEAMCLELEQFIGSDQSAHSEEARGDITQFRDHIANLDMYPLSSALTRLQAAPPHDQIGAA